MFKFKLFKEKKQDAPSRAGLGILVFENTSEVIQAENILRSNNWEIRVMGPPPEIQSGCDLVIEFPLIEELAIMRVLEKSCLLPLEMVPVTNPLLQPVNLFHTKDFGRFLMIRAANMKITVEKQTRLIVNISGGGCPDVPYLAYRLVGKTLDQAPDPMNIGHTLCGYALGLAFKEMQKKMLAVVGTVPDPDFPLTVGRVDMVEDKLVLNGRHVPVNRGTPALLGAMLNTLKVVGQKDITGFIAGDIGLGDGSRNIYQYIVENCSGMDLNTIVFHYLQPDVDWHNKILFVLKDLAVKPIMIADAGFMYAAKMSGQAEEYDLFTPDVGELAFLADETAPHPFYTRGFILHEDNKIPDLISRAYLHKNAAKNLLVKGSTDFVADKNGIISSLNRPAAEAMEAMGGTGDTLTGIVAALIGTGMKITKAAAIASTVNRLAGVYAAPTPATQVLEIIQQIPAALAKVLKE